MRSGFPRFSPESLAANRPIVAFLAEFATRKGATPSQVALAWLLAQKPFVVPIPGTRNAAHLAENLGATKIVLTSDDLHEIDVVLARHPFLGGRMNAEQMQQVEPSPEFPLSPLLRVDVPKARIGSWTGATTVSTFTNTCSKVDRRKSTLGDPTRSFRLQN
ncbi:aldo/keto reductase [Methylobacterium sp. J-076]|uniref:aldo/keto reductase n=1 Tax=Methylobacterium sp. J-076 TaxID=2836655 RepID=UPI001FBB1E25|nr:aldo/keto reductase [Methylobacterium sp. J-076]MCJ2011519.1 aldo/keto reductase [Methylobacterium sp. J-076]